MAITKTLSYETFFKYHHKTNALIKREYSNREIINMIDWMRASLPLNDLVLINQNDTNNIIRGGNTVEIISYINDNIVTCLQMYNNQRLKTVKEYDWVTTLQTNFFRLILLENANEIKYYL